MLQTAGCAPPLMKPIGLVATTAYTLNLNSDYFAALAATTASSCQQVVEHRRRACIYLALDSLAVEATDSLAAEAAGTTRMRGSGARGGQSFLQGPD